MKEENLHSFEFCLENEEYIENKIFQTFPTNIFPEKIENLVDALYRKAGFEKSVTASAILFTVSTIIGNSKQIKVKNVWIDTPNLWFAIVGKRGTLKTPTINFPIKPLQQDEIQFGKTYDEDLSSWNKLDKEKQIEEEKPIRRQRITTDATPEALIKLMKENPNGIGILKDELNGLFEEMDRYSSSGTLEIMLSAFNGGLYVKDRATQKSITVENIFLSIIGTIQPQVLKRIANNNTENGFIDRWLYVESENNIPDFKIDEDIDQRDIEKYNWFIHYVKEMSSNSNNMEWAPGSRKEFELSINRIRHQKRDEKTPAQLSAYLSKIETYLARFCILIPIMERTYEITPDHVKKAYRLAMFYVHTANNTFIGFDKEEEYRAIFKKERSAGKKDKIIALYKNIPTMQQKEICEVVQTDKSFVSKTIKEYQEAKKK